MNILAQYNENSGSSYHRVKLWADKVGAVLVKEITEKDIVGMDIVYIHWNSIIPLHQISIWKEKYRFTLIADIDDIWDDETRDLSLQQSNAKSKHLCFLADHIICSTEYVKTKIWASGLFELHKISVVPNILPKEGQFVPFKVPSEKIRVGIGGSISHVEDYLSLKKVIKRLRTEKWFNQKCEFHIIG